MQIDIRNGDIEEITEIVFHGSYCNGNVYDAVKLVLDGTFTKIINRGGTEEVYITSEGHAKNLIKALEKAISLGTWSK